jgi:hypothetical protein
MKKLKHEGELFKAGLLAAMKYAQERGAVVFEPIPIFNPSTLMSSKIAFICLLINSADISCTPKTP